MLNRAMIEITMGDGNKSVNDAAAQQPTWLNGGGDMGEQLRTFDWSQTSLGPSDTWPGELKIITNVVLNNRFPMLIWWGTDLVQIYNDSFRTILRDKHPAAFGAKAADTWREAWHAMGPMTEQIYNSREATWWEDYPFYIKSQGVLDEGYFTVGFSPIDVLQSPKAGGILITAHETTENVINERRLAILHDLAVHSIGNKSEGEVYRNIMNVLSKYILDLPFALLFKFNPVTKLFHLSGAAGLMRYEGPLKDADRWPLREVLGTGEVTRVDISIEQFGIPPKDEYGTSAKQAILLPVSRPEDGLEVVVVIALSPHRRNTSNRDRFISSLHEQLAMVVISARSREMERKMTGGKA